MSWLGFCVSSEFAEVYRKIRLKVDMYVLALHKAVPNHYDHIICNNYNSYRNCCFNESNYNISNVFTVHKNLRVKTDASMLALRTGQSQDFTRLY